VQYISAVDNIISMQYFHTVLPELKRRKLGVHFFYETKSNLKREQVQLLADAGVTSVQPGIESFSGHVLQLMRKGVTPLQNVQLLKWCAEYGVKPQWNLLCGFPGEEARDYQDVLQFLEAISHLPPAEGWGWLRLDRFSPYFDFPDQFGVRIKGALEPYRHLYPLDASRLYNIAYFFEYDFDGKGAVEQRFQPLQAELSRWKETHQHAHLQVARRTDDEIVVRDTRYNRRSPGYRFREPEKAILDLIDTTHTFTAIHEHLVTRMNGAAPGEGWLHGFLDYLVRHRLVLRDGDRYLSVILPSERQEPEGW
jgi:ribosomal peptide maturation radical SAM protein 1